MKPHEFSQFKHWGIVTDLPPEEVDPRFWTDCSNFRFQDQACVRVGGYDAFAAPLLGAPIFAMQCQLGAVAYWIYCGTQNVYVTDGETHWDITPTAGLSLCEAGDWTGCLLNGIPVLSNGVNEPIYWDFNTTARCAKLPGWPTGASCLAIRAFKYHLFALNIFDGGTRQPNTIWWSAGAAPGAIPQEWVPDPDNDAGDMVLADGGGDVVDGLALRDTFIVYKQTATFALNYVAGQYVYTQRKLFLTSGLQGRNCVMELNGEHWCFTGTDVIRHDGQNFTSLVENKVKHRLVESIDPNRTKLCCVSQRARAQQFWVCIPENGKPDLSVAYVFNVITGDCGVRELPGVVFAARGLVTTSGDNISWDSDTTPIAWDDDIGMWDQASFSPTYDSMLLCDAEQSKLWNVDNSDLADGQPLYAFLERQSLPINNPIQRALVVRVLPRITGGAGETIQIRVGGQPVFGAPITWSDPKDFVIGQDAAVDVQTEGRLISVRFEGTTRQQWKLHSYRLEAVDLGLF
jgi:hypothetical protein